MIGTSYFEGAIDLSYKQDAVIQGEKVGAAIVLLNVKLTTAPHYMGESDGVGPAFFWSIEATRKVFSFSPIGTTGTVFASYWAKADHAAR